MAKRTVKKTTVKKRVVAKRKSPAGARRPLARRKTGTKGGSDASKGGSDASK